MQAPVCQSLAEVCQHLATQSFAILRLDSDAASTIHAALQSTRILLGLHRREWLEQKEPPPPMLSPSALSPPYLLESNALRTQLRWQGAPLASSANVIPKEVAGDMKAAWDVMESLALSIIERCDPEAYRHAQHICSAPTERSQNIVDVFLYGTRGQDSQSTTFPCASHTDPGFLTLIMPLSPGLEVKTAEGTWIQLDLGPHDLAMVVGTAWTRLTGSPGQFKACYHRVRHCPGSICSSDLVMSSVSCSTSSLSSVARNRSSFTFEVRPSSAGNLALIEANRIQALSTIYAAQTKNQPQSRFWTDIPASFFDHRAMITSLGTMVLLVLFCLAE